MRIRLFLSLVILHFMQRLIPCVRADTRLNSVYSTRNIEKPNHLLVLFALNDQLALVVLPCDCCLRLQATDQILPLCQGPAGLRTVQ